MKKVTVFAVQVAIMKMCSVRGGEQFVHVIRFEQHWIPF
jgi:hypothetical protein